MIIELTSEWIVPVGIARRLPSCLRIFEDLVDHNF